MPVLLNKEYKVITEIKAEPICGEDFCDSCGDCLYCYGNDWCPENGFHSWVVDEWDIDEFLETHPDWTLYAFKRPTETHHSLF